MSIKIISEKPSSNKTTFEEGFFINKKTYIHSTAIIGQNVKIGDGVKIGPHCIIVGNVTIGANTKIYPSVTIGFPAQDLGVIQSLGTVEIGENCTIREFVSIHASKVDGGKTLISNNCYIMNFSHIAHDVVLENNVVLINNVNVGGHAHIEHNAMLMANAAIHQNCRIGRFSCVTPFSATRQDITPFCMFSGQPGKFAGLNLIALKRANIPKNSIDAIKHVSKLYFQDKLPLEKIKSLSQNEPWGHDKCATEFVNFIETSSRGISRKCFSYSKSE